MEIQQVGKRGMLFTFGKGDSPMAYPTAVYLITTEKYHFLCDTHVGPNSMKAVQDHVAVYLGEKPFIVFNTHSDYDHVWGNCAFPEEMIIAHELCKKVLAEKGEMALVDLATFKHGDVQLKLPTHTFDGMLSFENEGVEFFYSPGHTVDSASCFDREDGVLFVGDLLEEPLPYISHHILEDYLATLYHLKALGAKTIVSSHSGVVEEKLLDRTIAYLAQMSEGAEVELDDEASAGIHTFNLRRIAMAHYEDQARQKFGDEFSFADFMGVVKGQFEKSQEELVAALEEYLDQ